MNNKWRPDAEDMLDYANNVEHLSQALQLAEDIIQDYNEANKAHEPRQYKGTAEEIAEYIEDSDEA